MAPICFFPLKNVAGSWKQTLNFWWILEFYVNTLALYLKVPVLLTTKPLKNQILEKSVSALVIGAIADFFHDQTIFKKDCELYTIGNSLMNIVAF